MRFDRYVIPKMRALEWTSRRAAALRRKQRLEREALPLFAAQVAARQPSEDDVRAARQAAQDRWHREARDYAASVWRDARRRLRALPSEVAAAVLAVWNRSGCPGSHEYFAERVTRAERDEAAGNPEAEKRVARAIAARLGAPELWPIYAPHQRVTLARMNGRTVMVRSPDPDEGGPVVAARAASGAETCGREETR